MRITVLTPDKKIFEGEITSLKVPGTMGQFQVLKNHAPIVSSLKEGVVEMVTAAGEYDFFDDATGTIQTMNAPGSKVSYKISGGFVEVLNNEISLLLESILKR